MNFEAGKIYHVYNRSNAREIAFKEPENYLYFLTQFRRHALPCFDVIGYCLMPTHFHFLLRVNTDDIPAAQNAVGLWLSSYTKAINKRFQRNGSLFQHHTKAKVCQDQRYLMTLLSYIHQNPLRAKLVAGLEEWPYSSYPDLAGYRRGTLPDKEFIRAYFKTNEDFRVFSRETIREVKSEYWS